MLADVETLRVLAPLDRKVHVVERVGVRCGMCIAVVATLEICRVCATGQVTSLRVHGGTSLAPPLLHSSLTLNFYVSVTLAT